MPRDCHLHKFHLGNGAVEDVLPREKAGDTRFGGQAAFGQRVGPNGPHEGFERPGGRNCEPHTGRLAHPGPGDGRVLGHVAGLQAVGDERAIRSKPRRERRGGTNGAWSWIDPPDVAALVACGGGQTRDHPMTER